MFSVLYTFFFAYSMLSVLDELCMSAYVFLNVRSYHWILLDIQVDLSRVEIWDSLTRDTMLWSDMREMLNK